VNVVKTTIYLDRDLLHCFQRMAAGQGRSQAELIREAMDQYARKASVPKPKGWGKFDSGRKDISSKVDLILEEAGRKGEWP